MAVNQWFGPDTGRPVTRILERVETPVGKHCILCPRLIKADDEGLIVDYGGPSGTFSRRPVHIACLMENVGIRVGDV